MNLKDYGPPFSGTEAVLRATQFDGYDVFFDNCQHFAVWARYDKKLMLLSEEKHQASLRQMLGWATFVVAARAGNVPLEMAVFVGSLANVWTAKTGIMSQTVVGFEYVPGWYPDHVRQKMMSAVEVQVERRQFLAVLPVLASGVSEISSSIAQWEQRQTAQEATANIRDDHQTLQSHFNWGDATKNESPMFQNVPKSFLICHFKSPWKMFLEGCSGLREKETFARWVVDMWNQCWHER